MNKNVIKYPGLIIIFTIVSFGVLRGQQRSKEDSIIYSLGYTKKIITKDKDKIRFLILADSAELKKRKKLLIFCQGSGAVPILIHDQSGVFPPLPFTQLDSNYHIVIISKPGIPIYPDSLEGHNYLVHDQPPAAYLANDNLANYVFQVNAVIEYLIRQPYINSKDIVVFGHSQGARVAAAVAAGNKRVTQVIVASINPYSRFQGFVYEARVRSLLDTVHAEEYQKKIDSIYTDYRKLLFDKKAQAGRSLYDGSTINTWISFTEPPAIEQLLKINVPLLLLYGTADLGSDDMDNVPFAFIRKKKNNLTLKPWLNLEHNFFGVYVDGKVNYNDYHWNEVAAYIFDWLAKH